MARIKGTDKNHYVTREEYNSLVEAMDLIFKTLDQQTRQTINTTHSINNLAESIDMMEQMEEKRHKQILKSLRLLLSGSRE